MNDWSEIDLRNIREWNESKHPRDGDGKFTSGNKLASAVKKYSDNPERDLKDIPRKKMTPAEKIASVHIDFDRDNILPELNEDDLVELNAKKNKPVLLKKTVIDKNEAKHNDLSREDSELIIGSALYSAKKEIIPNKDRRKPNYYSFAAVVRTSRKTGEEICGVVLLDIDETKSAFEIVHWHYVPYSKLDNIRGK